MKIPIKLTLVIVALAAIVIGFSSYQAAERGEAVHLWFFDIGQGDAALFDLPDQQQVLIDGGPNASIVARLGRAMPLSDKNIELIIVTHNDADHLSGILEVIKHYQVGKIWVNGASHTTQTYKKFMELVDERNIPLETVVAGAVAEFGPLKGIAIFPLKSVAGQLPQSQNDFSIVTLWQYSRYSILLTGDIEVDQERELLERNLIPQTTILKIAHHGSQTSSSVEFLKAARPELAVISAGRNNRYGHPHAAVLERLAELSVPALRTDQDRSIRFQFWADSYRYQTGL